MISHCNHKSNHTHERETHWKEICIWRKNLLYWKDGNEEKKRVIKSENIERREESQVVQFSCVRICCMIYDIEDCFLFVSAALASNKKSVLQRGELGEWLEYQMKCAAMKRHEMRLWWCKNFTLGRCCRGKEYNMQHWWLSRFRVAVNSKNVVWL